MYIRQISTVIVTKENINESIKEIFDYDDEISRGNTNCKEALELDINHIDYLILLADREKLSGKEKVEFISEEISEYYKSMTSFVHTTELSLTEIDDSTFIAVFVMVEGY